MTADGYGLAIFAQHADTLAAAGITPDRARRRGYVSVDTKKRLEQLGVTASGRNIPGLLVPQLDKQGSTWGYQYRPDRPRLRDGKPVKYETPVGQRNGIDVPPGVGAQLGDPAVPLWVTEGVKKADSAAEHGVCCVALPGVWSWRGRNGQGGKVAVGDWQDIALNGRRVILAFDSDVMVKPSVRSALVELAKYLATKGARVEYAHLPDDGDGKCGLDDYLIGHTVDDLWRLVRPEPPAVAVAPDRSIPPDSSATVPPPPATAPELAYSLRILDRLAADAVALGVVGERAVVATTYLTITGRLLDKGPSLAVKGHSASGKSYTVQTIVGLFPPEAVCEWTGMSERALVYSREEYAHRTIVLYEAAALRERAEQNDGNQTAYLMRSLLSEGQLVYEVTVKDKDGGFVTKKITKKGPTNLVVTTTAVRLHPENETRLLSMTTDDSQAQTRAVLRALADESERHVDIEKWRQLQRWLAAHGEHRVTIPYAQALTELVPPVAVRLRRDIGSLLALIRAHAMLHQLNRDRDPAGRVVASIDDYEAVRNLVGPALSDGVGATVSPTVRDTVNAVTALDNDDGVTASVLAARLKLDKSAARRRLLAAADDGYVQNLEDKKGRPGRWRPAAPLPDDLELLPQPGDLVAHTPAPDATTSATTQQAPTPGFSLADASGGTVARESQGVKQAATEPTCDVCRERIDPVAGRVHPSCDTGWDVPIPALPTDLEKATA